MGWSRTTRFYLIAFLFLSFGQRSWAELAGVSDPQPISSSPAAEDRPSCTTAIEKTNCEIRRTNCDKEFASLKLQVPDEYKIKCDHTELCASPVSATQDFAKGCGYAIHEFAESIKIIAQGTVSFVSAQITDSEKDRREHRLRVEDRFRRNLSELRERLAPYADKIRARCGEEPPDFALPDNFEFLTREDQVRLNAAKNKDRLKRMPFIRCQAQVLGEVGFDPSAGRNREAFSEMRELILKELASAKVKLQCYNPVGQMKIACGVLGGVAAKPASAIARTELRRLTGIELKIVPSKSLASPLPGSPNKGDLLSWRHGAQTYTARVVETRPDGSLVLQDAGGFRREISREDVTRLGLQKTPDATAEAFTKLEKTGQLPEGPTRPVREISLETNATPRHIGNIPDYATDPGTRFELSKTNLQPGQRVSLLGKDLQGRFAGDPAQKHKISQVSPDGKYAEATAADGSRIYLRVTDENSGQLKLIQIHPDEAPFDLRRRTYVDGDMLARVKSGFNARKLSDDEYVKQLTQGQLSASSTVTHGPATATVNLQEMNRKVVDRIRSPEPLTRDDLSQWNRLANKDVIDSSLAETPGVVRGTRVRVLDPASGSVKVDLTNTQLAASGGDRTSVVYIPAKEVPKRLDGLLSRVNQLTPKSSLREVASIYMDYIKIHPFVDGNGRTARALVDYSLARAGLPPIPAGRSLPREALFQSPDELAATLRALYGH